MASQSQIIIGETGAIYPVTSLSELKSLFETYFNQLGITQKDISIVNNLEQNFIYLNNLEYKPDSKYFLFNKRYNKKLLESFRLYQNKNNVGLTSNQVGISINIPDIAKYLHVLEENNEYLTCSIGNIKETFEIMVTYYNNFNNIYKNFKGDVKMANKIKEYFKYQDEAVELLNNIALIKYEKCFSKYQEFIKDSGNTKTKNYLIYQEYLNNIDRLKKIELPESFIKYISKIRKSNNIKYLIDIYYKENDMNIWRDNCLNNQECFFNKIKTKDKILQKEKIQINKDTNSFLTPLKNGWNFYISEYEKLYNDKNSYILTLLNEMNNDFSSFNNILGQIKEIFESKLLNSNPNYRDNIKDSCAKILSFKEKYSDMNKLSSLTNYLQPFTNYINKMNNSIDNISKKINDYFMSVRAIKNILEKLTEKFVEYYKGLKRIEEDYKYLETPSHFINSYDNTLLELKRRYKFNSNIQEEIIKIKALINNENYQRKKFIEENKKYLTPDFIKLFKLENKITFNYDLQNNNENLDLAVLLPEENNSNESTKVYSNISTINNNNFANTGTFLSENSTFNGVNKNGGVLYQNILNQINEMDTKLKRKEKELFETQNKYSQLENNFLELQKDINNLHSTFDEISDSFNIELSFKEKKIEELSNNIQNMQNTLTIEKKSNAFEQKPNCPLCREYLTNGQNYQNIENVIIDLKKEIAKNKKQITDLDINYKKLINNTVVIKKSFFNHMNMVITQKNLEMSKFKERQEEKVMYIEDILAAEKIYNKNSVNEKFNKLNNKIKEYKAIIGNNNETINNFEKINSKLKSNELFLKRELQISMQKNEKLSDNNIELTNELRQKHKDNANLTKLLDISKKEHVDSIKILNSTHQANIDCLTVKLNELSEKIKEKENEDSKKYQQFLNMKEQYSQILQEKEMHINKIKELSIDLQEKNKKIDELLQTQESINQSETHISKTTNANTYDLTISLPVDEDILYFKKIEKGLRCIFVPFYENIFVCINLSDNLGGQKGDNDMYPVSNYECKYILDLNSFNQDLSKIIVDNSLIVIGKISKLTELEQKKNKFLNLPEDKKFVLVTLGKIDYVIGFPENELVFNNYLN